MKKADYECLGFEILSNDEINPDGEVTLFQWRKLTRNCFSSVTHSDAMIEIRRGSTFNTVSAGELTKSLHTMSSLNLWRPALNQPTSTNVIIGVKQLRDTVRNGHLDKLGDISACVFNRIDEGIHSIALLQNEAVDIFKSRIPGTTMTNQSMYELMFEVKYNA
jgi:hypothetical protein